MSTPRESPPKSRQHQLAAYARAASMSARAGRTVARARPREAETFRGHIVSALGPRTRIATDAEGWPLCPGKYGSLEWRGAEADGSHRIYAYSGAGRVIATLCAVPGIAPKQTGDGEAAFSMGAGDVPAIRAAAGLLRLRTRRSPGTGRSAAEMALMRAGTPRQKRAPDAAEPDTSPEPGNAKDLR